MDCKNNDQKEDINTIDKTYRLLHVQVPGKRIPL